MILQVPLQKGNFRGLQPAFFAAGAVRASEGDTFCGQGVLLAGKWLSICCRCALLLLMEEILSRLIR